MSSGASYKGLKWTYYDEGYCFHLVDEKLHLHTTLIIKPEHVVLLYNETNRPDLDLKKYIIQEWFAEQNDLTRARANKKRREKKNESQSTSLL